MEEREIKHYHDTILYMNGMTPAIEGLRAQNIRVKTFDTVKMIVASLIEECPIKPIIAVESSDPEIIKIAWLVNIPGIEQKYVPEIRALVDSSGKARLNMWLPRGGIKEKVIQLSKFLCDPESSLTIDQLKLMLEMMINLSVKYNLCPPPTTTSSAKSPENT